MSDFDPYDPNAYRAASSYLRRGDTAEAVAAFRALVTRRPQDVAALRGLHDALDAQAGGGYAGEDERAHLRARSERLEGRLFAELAGADEALARRALKQLDDAGGVRDKDPALQWRLAEAFRAADLRPSAQKAYRRYLARAKNDPVALHMLAAVGGAPTPARADADFLAAWFEPKAPTWVASPAAELVAETGVALLPSVMPDDPYGVRCLDLGCGTGAVGQRLRPHVAQMEGVDVSPAMLSRARKLCLYNSLDLADLTRHVRKVRRKFHLVLAADALPWVGDLRGLLTILGSRMPGGAALVFNVDVGEEPRPVLRRSGRFSHSRAHLEATAPVAGFEIQAVAEQAFTDDAGGLLCVLRKTP